MELEKGLDGYKNLMDFNVSIIVVAGNLW